MNGLEKAINLCGSQAALADRLKVSRMTVSHWKRRGVPLERVFDIELATDGEVTRYDLRPDKFRRDAA